MSAFASLLIEFAAELRVLDRRGERRTIEVREAGGARGRRATPPRIVASPRDRRK